MYVLQKLLFFIDLKDFHMDVREWDDIAYSFLVGEDGLVYEGRGWDTVGSHAPWYNFRSLGTLLEITFIFIRFLAPNFFWLCSLSTFLGLSGYREKGNGNV